MSKICCVLFCLYLVNSSIGSPFLGDLGDDGKKLIKDGLDGDLGKKIPKTPNILPDKPKIPETPDCDSPDGKTPPVIPTLGGLAHDLLDGKPKDVPKPDIPTPPKVPSDPPSHGAPQDLDKKEPPCDKETPDVPDGKKLPKIPTLGGLAGDVLDWIKPKDVPKFDPSDIPKPKDPTPPEVPSDHGSPPDLDKKEPPCDKETPDVPDGKKLPKSPTLGGLAGDVLDWIKPKDVPKFDPSTIPKPKDPTPPKVPSDHGSPPDLDKKEPPCDTKTPDKPTPPKIPKEVSEFFDNLFKGFV